MADLALGAARSVVEGTLTKVQSAIETEAKLRQSAQSDLAFITEEFQMMRSFLEVVDEGHAKNKVVGTWVGQVRELAYDVEDGMEFVAHLDTKSDWWRRWLLPCMARPLDEAVAELKQLKVRVEDVSNRNIRYNLISESGFKPITQMEQLVSSAAIGATSLDMLTEVRSNEKFQQDLDTLCQLITNGGNDALRVIWVWGTGDDLSFMSIVRKAYQTPDICQIFPYRGWVNLTRPLNPHEVLRSLMAQFYKNSCLQSEATTVDVYVDKLARMEEASTTQVGLIKEFMKQTKEKRYLVVLENVTTLGQWDAIRTYLPDINNGSLVIMCTQQRELANMCVADSYQALEMKHYSACVLFKEVNAVNIVINYFQEKKGPRDTEAEVNDRCGRKSCDRIPTSKRDEVHSWMERFTLVGRESQMDLLDSYLVQTQYLQQTVISVWGIPGVGKSALVRYCYYRKMLIRENRLFQRYSWVNVSHPFNLRDFCQSILSGLHSESSHTWGVDDPIQMCSMLLKEDRCLVVIDDLLSNEEWDLIQPALVSRDSRSAIVVITNDSNIATHCAGSEEFVINVTCLKPEAANVLFRNEVRQRNPGSVLINSRALGEVAELISKCGGIPKVIVAIANVLAPQTFTALNSTTKLNTRFMHELESNPDLFDSVQEIFRWMDSFIRTRPDFLKQCLLYLSVFPRQHIIRRRRLVRRWIAEGYCKDTESSSEERGEWSFSKLVDLSMIQQPSHSATDVLNYRRMIFCQVNNFVAEYVFSQPMEEKLVLQLKDRCPLTTQSTGRHLVIQHSWDRDIIIFENIDFSRLRSLTVFGEWRSFFISESMRVLRVLDLEDASGVTDKDLEKMVKLLPRLKFLSLRGCTNIRHLPSSLGVLRQLETLDVRETSIVTMPVTITKLKKLQYLRAGTATLTEERQTACSASRLFEFISCQQVDGVKMPNGIEKLTALHTLGVVNVSDAGGKAILKKLKKLTQLRKLGVSGISNKNIKEFCSAISCHVHLASLSVRLSKGNQDCLNNMNCPRGNLQSFKLFGFVKGLPAWIKDLDKLTKLDLDITMSENVVGVIQVLGEIRELSILRLCVKLLLQNGDGKLDFITLVNGLQCRSFEKLKILEIACSSSNLLHVSFGSDSMINLELLTARCCSESTLKFLDLQKSLRKLKEVRLVGSHDDKLKEDIENQLKEHRNKPSLKQVEEPRSSRRYHGYSA